MASIGPTDSIGDRAAAWAVETAYGEMTPQARAELARWLAADTRHRGAYARACAWLRAVEEAVVEAPIQPTRTQAAADAPALAGRSARPSDNDNGGEHGGTALALRNGLARWGGRVAAGGMALAAALAALLMVGIHPASLIFPARDAASKRVVELKDGSFATLGKDDDIRVVLSNDIRRVTMLKGAATFRVAKDRGRPFVVRSGDVYAQATGTVYSVSRVGPTGGTVKVSEGSVLVWARDERDQAVLLHAGGTLTLDPGPRSGLPPQAAAGARRLPPPDVAQISLDNVTIASAVARFNRINSRKIIIADPALGDVRIIGLYKANDPQRFALAAAAISGSSVKYEEGNIVIVMK